MLRFFATLLVLLLAAANVRAEDGAEPAKAATQPAPSTQSSRPLLLVLPFTMPAPGNYGWVAKSLQEALVTKLGQDTYAQVDLSPGPANDVESALQTARASQASMAVFGKVQLNAPIILITGQLLDVSTGKPLVDLRAMGSLNEFYSLQDAIVRQVVLALPKDWVATVPPPVVISHGAPSPMSGGAGNQFPPPAVNSPQPVPPAGFYQLPQQPAYYGNFYNPQWAAYPDQSLHYPSRFYYPYRQSDRFGFDRGRR